MPYKVQQDVIDWLLEDNNPSVSFLTQIKLLETDVNDTKFSALRKKINSYEPIAEILANQKENYYWFDNKKDKNYKKYLGSFWQLLFLYELHAQKNEQITNGIEHIFNTGQASNGGFSVSGTNSFSIPCLTANMVRMLVYFGYGKDERTKKAVEFLLTRLERDNGSICFQMTNMLDSCYMTLPKILHALASIPENERSTRVQNGIDLCVKTILKNQIFKYVPDNNKDWLKYVSDNKIKGKQQLEERTKFMKNNPSVTTVAKPGWLKFRFHLNYNSDILDAMRALASLGISSKPEMKEALEIIKEKAIQGKWVSEKQYKSPMYAQIEEYQKESKWITLHALTVLKHFEGLVIE